MKHLTTLSLVLALSSGAALAETDITFAFWGTPEEGKVWNEIAAAFEAENPDITLNIEVSDWNSYWEKLRVNFAGGSPPDVFAMSPPLYLDWKSRDVLLNLQPWIDAEPEVLDGIYPVTLEAYETPDGYFGLPRDFQTIVLYYNKDIFDAAGQPYPTEDWTWNDLKEAALALTIDNDGDSRPDQWGLAADLYGPESFMAPLLRSYGADLVSADASETTVDTPEATEAFQFIYDMAVVDGSIPDQQTVASFGWDPFLAGVTGMTLKGHWTVPDYAAAPFGWNIAPIPQGPDGRVTTVNSAGFVAASTTEHPDEVWKFLKFVTSDAGQSLAAQIGLAVPIRESVAMSPAYLEQDTAAIDHQMFVDALDYARRLPSFRGFDEWGAAFGDTLDRVWTDEMDLSEGLEEITIYGNDALDKNR